jgi:hypothetical protein
MWRYPRWLPQTGDPCDPDRLHECIQPYADGAYDLDEHDFVDGGISASSVTIDHVAAAGADVNIDPQIIEAVQPWQLGVGNVHESDAAWDPVANTDVEVTTVGGLVVLSGIVQVAHEVPYPSSPGTEGAKVGVAILLDGLPVVVLASPESDELLTSRTPFGISGGARVVEGRIPYAAPYALDVILPVEAGDHVFQLAVMARYVLPTYTYSGNLSVIELRV